MQYVKELKRYSALMAAAVRAGLYADALYSVDFERACDYEEISQGLAGKALALQSCIRSQVRNAPTAEQRHVERKVLKLAQRLTGIHI